MTKSACTDQQFIDLCQSLGSPTLVAKHLGVAVRSVYNRRTTLVGQGHKIDFWNDQRHKENAPSEVVDTSLLEDEAKRLLRKGAFSLDELSCRLGVTREAAKSLCDGLREDGYNVCMLGERYAILTAPEPRGQAFEYVSRPDNTFLFGCISDNHIGSRYERLDVANDLYDKFVEYEVDRVFNAGNWIDGEDHKNQFDLKIRGLEPQMRYLADVYPRREGIHTYAVAGEDHEGWYSRRESIDVGRFAESVMREAGRDDWHDLGFIEAKIDLVNANTGARTSLVVMHPGGGSAYAISYTPQKIVESFEGGEKPAVLLIGHYHKLSLNLIRNVWTAQIGCTEDQTVFMRKMRIDAHVGGMIMELEQDPDSGAIVSCTPRIYRYFSAAYYNGRWSKVGDVVLPKRAIK